MSKLRSLWLPNLIVFVSNACIMIIELVAGRIMAPYVGVSLYTWTSVIGVVLAGISLGNYLGGKIADRYASREVLGLIFFISALSSLSIALFTQVFGDAVVPQWLPLMLEILFLTTLFFFLPSAILGTVSPLVIKLTLKDLDHTGNVVGRIYASSALGSILGTFATGFFLISWFGTRTIVWVVSLVLVVMALLFGDVWRLRRRWSALLVVFAVSSIALSAGGGLDAPCYQESNYFCIKVREETRNDGTVVRTMILDRLVHSYTALDDPTYLTYGYEKVYAEATEYLAREHNPLRTLFIGGGGYTFPRYVQAVYPESDIEVIEIDPAVTEVAHREFGLPRDTEIVTHNQDARLFIERLAADRKYDLIYGDAFNDYSVPYHLTTLEFDLEVKEHLRPGGYYVMNVVDGQRGLFLRATLNTLRAAFRYVYLVPVAEDWQNAIRSTYVLMAGERPLDVARFRGITGDDAAAWFAERLVPQAEVRRFLAAGDPLLLTDQHAPVDNLLAPVFKDTAS